MNSPEIRQLKQNGHWKRLYKPNPVSNSNQIVSNKQANKYKIFSTTEITTLIEKKNYNNFGK